MMEEISILSLTKSTGGIAHYNKSLLPELESAGFTSHTLCLSENRDEYAADLRASGLGAEAVAMERYRISMTSDLGVMRRVLKTVRERRTDVILCHGSKPGFIGRAAGRIAGVPVVYCQASLPFMRRIQGAKAPLYWTFELVARGFGGHIVALTEGAKRATVAYGLVPGRRVAVIRTGIDVERFRPRGRRDEVVADLGLDPARPVVGWLARLEPQKAPLDFVAALRDVAPKHPAAQFVIAGEGRLQAAVRESIAESGLSDRVTLLPWQSDPGRTLEGFDIFALSSRWEGLPITLLEAMASGCAPVSTDVDGCADAIVDGVSGRLVPAADPGAMARALDGLLAAPGARKDMALAARQRIEQEFERRKMVATWSELLRRIVAKAPLHGLAEAV